MTPEKRVPFEIAALGEVDGGVLAIVDAAVAALGCADLEHVAAQAVALAHHARCVHTVGDEAAQRAFAQAIGGHNRDICGVIALIGKGKGSVRLSPTVADVELRGLFDAQVVLRGQTHHDLTECKNKGIASQSEQDRSFQGSRYGEGHSEQKPRSL